MIGGVAGELLHGAPCSVLVARPAGDPRRFPRSIVAGVDGSAAAEAALAVARAARRAVRVPLRVVTACEGKGVDPARVRRPCAVRRGGRRAAGRGAGRRVPRMPTSSSSAVAACTGCERSAASRNGSRTRRPCSVLVVRASARPRDRAGRMQQPPAEVAAALGTDHRARSLGRTRPRAGWSGTGRTRRAPAGGRPYLRLALHQLLDPLVGCSWSPRPRSRSRSATRSRR